MKIIVTIKQVPESSNVKMDPATGTIIRAGVESVVNPLDLYAIEEALRLKEKYGGEVCVITMGPPQAKRVLKEAIAMGCDSGYLVTDRAFGGADTWATSYTLSQAIKQKIGYFDLLLSGERATDGDTAQVGPGIASWLDIPAITYVSKIEVSGSYFSEMTQTTEVNEIKAERLIEEGYQQVMSKLPCMCAVLKEIAQPRLPTLKGKINSMEAEIVECTASNMQLEPFWLGLKGSPTKVTKIESPKIMRNGKTLNVTDDEACGTICDEIVAFLEEKGAL
jgi:electron transfer flavoprotein beta subunit